jgi:hypothetical protein
VVIVVGSIALTIAVCVAVPAAWLRRSVEDFRQLSLVVSTVPAILRDLEARGQRLPSAVPLRDLISQGYVAAEDVPAFDGIAITLEFTANEAYPQEPSVRVLAGREVVAITYWADGRICSYPR